MEILQQENSGEDMEFSNDIKQFIENYKSFIEHDQWEFIYDELSNYNTKPALIGAEIAQLTTIFSQAGINPLDYLTYIPEGYFFLHTDLAIYKVPDNIVEIRSTAFESSTIKKLIANSVENISSNAFFDCSQLIEIELSEKINNIKPAAFDQCNHLSKIKYNNTFYNLSSKDIDWSRIKENSQSDKLIIECTDKTFEV